jgi:hypothetical protein
MLSTASIEYAFLNRDGFLPLSSTIYRRTIEVTGIIARVVFVHQCEYAITLSLFGGVMSYRPIN